MNQSSIFRQATSAKKSKLPQLSMVKNMAAQKQHERRGHIARPLLHITSPLGWLNDPCAPCYDPSTNLYHVFYQCNPHGTRWGNISWGHAVSKDQVTWDLALEPTVLEPDRAYDKDGVFTGCMAPITHDDEPMTLFYSSICRLPFHWTNPAPRGSAGLSLATSTDHGQTWTKSTRNPILRGEPEGVEVTGFRDPYVAPWDGMDKVRGQKALYGLVSGGIQGKGPTAFMYAVDPRDPSRWTYLGPLVDVAERFAPSTKWNCSYGMNWECVNFMTLSDGEVRREVLILGSEGDEPRAHLQPSAVASHGLTRPVRNQQWMVGDLVSTCDGGARMRYCYGGILDHGVYYAANSFQDVKKNRRIVYGWVPEDDCPADVADAKGWNGSLALPREIWLKRTRDVVGALRSRLQDITCSEMVRQDDGMFTEYTLGIGPIGELKKLRDSALMTTQVDSFSLPDRDPASLAPASLTAVRQIARTASSAWELSCTIRLPAPAAGLENIRAVGLHIRASEDQAQHTTIRFIPDEERLCIVRDKSLPISQPNADAFESFNVCTEEGPLTLYTLGMEGQLEPLELRIISDASVLEVFVNERFALTTMVYTAVECGGVSAFVEYDSHGAKSESVGEGVVFEKISIWDGLGGEVNHIRHGSQVGSGLDGHEIDLRARPKI